MPSEAVQHQSANMPNGAADNLYKGSVPMKKNIEAYGVEVGEGHVWLDDNTCVLRGGKIRYKLTGLIRGCDLAPFTYFFNNYSQLDSFVLREWIYYIKEV
jgi:hypothetical protein